MDIPKAGYHPISREFSCIGRENSSHLNPTGYQFQPGVDAVSGAGRPASGSVTPAGGRDSSKSRPKTGGCDQSLAELKSAAAVGSLSPARPKVWRARPVAGGHLARSRLQADSGT